MGIQSKLVFVIIVNILVTVPVTHYFCHCVKERNFSCVAGYCRASAMSRRCNYVNWDGRSVVVRVDTYSEVSNSKRKRITRVNKFVSDFKTGNLKSPPPHPKKTKGPSIFGFPQLTNLTYRLIKGKCKLVFY